ncbi:MAG: four helix bundle protein [Deltaproteobacteria bacterium]|nr:four helix bundle protein [Deltaproteobacteria bacterium]
MSEVYESRVGLRRPLLAGRCAERAAGLAIAVGQTLPPSVRCLSDQLTRAALSTPLNLAEGLGRTGRDRLHHLRIAYGSVREAQSAARIVVASGLGDGEKAAQLVAELDQLGARVWGLIRWAGG